MGIYINIIIDNTPQNRLDSAEHIKYFHNHPGIKAIKNKFRNSFNFKFEFVSTNIVLRSINEIDIKESSCGENLLPLLN